MKPPLQRGAVASLTPQLPVLSDPAGANALLELLRVLYSVGRHDLPLGRLFEGHVDALQIIARYGGDLQAVAAHTAARGGAVFGVWNADLPAAPLRLTDGCLQGGKAFASGAGLLSHALVSVDVDQGRQLLLIDLERTPPAIDRSWWRVTGMQRSETHVALWDRSPLQDCDFIGMPNDYLQEPWFSGGALRFAAVQAGGITAVVDLVRDHLAAQERSGNSHQRDRLAQLYLAAQSAADAVARAAREWSSKDVEATLAYVAAARVAVYEAGERILTLAQAAVGVQAMFLDHPLAEALADLTVYLRQPDPDAQRTRLGASVASAILNPSL